MQGQHGEAPLTDRGRRQAQEAADALARAGLRSPVRLYSSDLVRAAQTAGIIAPRLGVDPLLTPLLREQALGQMEGRLARDLRAEPVPTDLDVSEVAWGGGETIEQVWHRVARFTESHLANPAEDDVVVVSHGILLQVFVAYLDGRSHREVDWELGLRNGGVVARPLPAFPGRRL